MSGREERYGTQTVNVDQRRHTDLYPDIQEVRWHPLLSQELDGVFYSQGQLFSSRRFGVSPEDRDILCGLGIRDIWGRCRYT